MRRDIPDTCDEGRYEIAGELGRGGMATVVRARDTTAETDVALKILHPHFVDDDAIVEAFEREASLMQSLDHPGVLRVHATTTVGDRPAIVTDLLEGGDLHRRLQLRGRLSEEQTVDIAAQLLEALQYVHDQNVIHRDVKPHNVVFDADDRPVLIDFGIGQQQQAAETSKGAQLGTVEYMAPERIDGLAVDGRADLYGLAITLFEMVCGHPPYRADSPTAVMQMHRDGDVSDPSVFVAELSDQFCDVVTTALAPQPEGRFDSAEAMRTALQGDGPERVDIETHPRWERILEEYEGENALVSTDDGEEWVVYLRTVEGTLPALLEFQLEVLQQIYDAFPEHQVPGNHPDLSEVSPVQQTSDTDIPFGTGEKLSTLAVARGLSEAGARQLADRLEEAHIPVATGRREADLPDYAASLLHLPMGGDVGVFLFLAVVIFALPLIFAVGFAASPSLAVIAGASITGGLVATSRWKRNNYDRWMIHIESRYALDFRLRRHTETHLIDERHAQLKDGIASPRLRASFDRIANAVLLLEDELDRRTTDGATASTLEPIADGASSSAAEIADLEREISSIRPAALVRDIERIDRRIAASDNADHIEELMGRKSELQSQLERRDDAEQRLAALAQRMLRHAAELEELLVRFRADEAGAESLHEIAEKQMQLSPHVTDYQ